MKKNNKNKEKNSNKRVNPKLKRTINKISLAVSLLLGIFTFYLIYKILVLNMIPTKFLWLIIGILLVILFVVSFFLVNKKIKWKIKIGIIVFSLLFNLLQFFGIRYIDATIGLIGKITGTHIETETYYVLALNSNKAEKLEDIDSEIGYTVNIGNIKEAVEELNKKGTFAYKDYNQVIDLVNDLLNKKVEYILLADYHKQMIEEENEKFKNIKIVYTITIEKNTKVEKKEVDITKDAFSIYISGIDTYGRISSVSRSDVNIIATINPTTKQILLTTIPRDSYVTLRGFNAKDKLTHAGVYGIETSVGTLEDLLDIDINYYVRVNFSTLVKIVDALKGINVYSEVAFKITGGNDYFVKGYNYLNGKQALAFSRERKAFLEGDVQRGRNQQAVIKALIDKIVSPSIITNYTSLLNSLEGTFQTNMSDTDIKKFARFQIDKMISWDIQTISIDGTNASEYTYSYGNRKLYVMIPNNEKIEYVKAQLDKMFKNETISIKHEEASGVVVHRPPVQPVETTNDQNEENNVNPSDDNTDIIENEQPVDDSKPDNEVETPEDSSIEQDNSNNPTTLGDQNEIVEDNTSNNESNETVGGNTNTNESSETVEGNTNNESKETIENEESSEV